MNRKKPLEPERTRMKLSQLKDHPLQAQTYTPTSHEEDERLKAVLRGGCYDPLHVMPSENAADLPGGTKLDGHRRARLLADLGFDEAEVLVRHDLATADRATVDIAFYDFALGRRNCHPLDLSRMVLKRYELEKNRPRKRFLTHDYQETRDRIAKLLGMSGRNFGRYYNVLLCPVEVQNALRDKRLELIPASRVTGLSPQQQQEIAARIRDGEDPRAVVGCYIASSNGRHKRASDAFSCFAKSLQKGLPDLEDRCDEIHPTAINKYLPLLQRSRQVLARLITRSRDKSPSTLELLKDSATE